MNIGDLVLVYRHPWDTFISEHAKPLPDVLISIDLELLGGRVADGEKMPTVAWLSRRWGTTRYFVKHHLWLRTMSMQFDNERRSEAWLRMSQRGRKDGGAS